MKNPNLLSTQALVFGCVGISGVCLIIGLIIGRFFFNGYPPPIYLHLFFAFTLSWWIVSSLITIIRRELPISIGSPSIKGFWAVFIGVVQLIVLSLVEIYFLYSAILYLLVK